MCQFSLQYVKTRKPQRQQRYSLEQGKKPAQNYENGPAIYTAGGQSASPLALSDMALCSSVHRFE